MESQYILSPEKTVTHLTAETWNTANRILLKKAIAEFAHERIITPQLLSREDPWEHYVLSPKRYPGVEYRFRARKLHLDHWLIDGKSIEKLADNSPAVPDLTLFIIEFREEAELSKAILPAYLEEVSSTLYGQAYIIANRRNKVDTLVHAGYQAVEHGMTGHPTFIANNGRIGLNADDYRKYAPEADAHIRLLWLAVHQSNAEFSSIDGLDYQKLMAQELTEETFTAFREKVKAGENNPDAYYFIPVHPWQWYNKLNHIFAADIASGKILFLGEGQDRYFAQQSIRTFYNMDHPGKFYVKTALSILNMGFVRGLSPYYMNSTPAINQWVENLVNNDGYLRKKGFTILKEVAAIGYKNRYYEQAIADNSTPYTKMLASLWRETPHGTLQKGQKLMTMAALLHQDHENRALLPELIKNSGTDTAQWVEKYLDCYLSPILHCFYAHDLVFMPHGENLILVMENHLPVKVLMKDIAEEIGVLSKDKKLPGKTNRIAVDVPDDFKLTYIFTDVFDCFFRYISAILQEHCHFSDDEFWKLVARCILNYQQEHPALAPKFEKFDLFAPEFKRCCLNRLQIHNNKQMVDLAAPIESLKFAGTLKNPVSLFRPVFH